MTDYGAFGRRDLSFAELRQANVSRIPLFKNCKGETAHSTLDGSDWSPAQWLQALTGELGEYANQRKKLERGDITPEQFAERARNELADVMIYLDLLAFRLNIDLAEAVREKFNAVSRRIGCGVFLGKAAQQAVCAHISMSRKETGIGGGSSIWVCDSCSAEFEFKEWTSSVPVVERAHGR